ncbi:accessory gene regulator ArgB-like protein [Cohnella panacarvi]|uniref:accessory gene regulator ArgB-like protein n=1 Tax=Cohnella panacarvi TaxID=400776 RepID=UPI00047E7D45|nr:accessory gene regulator B family protein [Cohnella panacarvi]
MIEALSNRLALKMKQVNPEQTTSVEVMSFALQGLLQNTLAIITAFIVGVFLGKPWETVIAVISFMGLRFVSGGHHFNSALLCFLSSAGIFIVIPLLNFDDMTLMVLNCISLIIVCIFAPSDIREHIRLPEKYFLLFKLASVLLVAINFMFLSSIVTIAFTIQAVTLVPFTRR